MDLTGFTVLSKAQMSEVDGTATLFEHTLTRAQILSVVNHDENKCFGVSFRTPPSDSTGVAHIMEHSVLCGSAKYPVKEPFVELLKGSLQTFLNAFTFPDKTCYPVASANLQDFYNLIDVYLDAVFHPKITENIFRQEGWHIEALTGDSKWTYKGVVFNEMKGAYSSPDSLLSEHSQQILFPDMLYSLDSGGDPERIPDLTYEAFKAFHENYYHPSNARFFFWGDDPEEQRLEIIRNQLAGVGYRAVNSEIPLQKPFSTPRKREVAYAAGNAEQKCMFTVNWLLGERGDVHEALQMEMLSHILQGMPGSPLERALISSGLGEETTGCGLETDLRQMYYSVGLKGIKEEDVPRAETVIFDTLAALVRDGIPKETVEAAVNSAEFSYRESNTGSFPRGLAAMVQALSTWLYDGDPLAALAWEAPLAEIKRRLAQGERVFEQLIENRFLNNQHRGTVVLLPDLNLGARREEKEAARLEALHSASTGEQRARFVQETQELQKAQMTPDSPEALATIPALGVSDLPRNNQIIPETRLELPCTCLSHEQPTQGIAYVSLLLPLTAVPDRLLPLLPLFLRTITEIGTSKHDYVTLGERIAAKTGGVHAGMAVGTEFGTGALYRYFSLGGKVVYDKLEDLFDLFQEVLLCPLSDRKISLERIGQMLLETKAQLEESMQSAGHAVVSTRLGARYSLHGAIAERTGGVSYLNSVRNYVRLFEEEPDRLLDDLAVLRSAIVGAENAIVSCTAEEKGLSGIYTRARDLVGLLPRTPVQLAEKCDVPAMNTLPKAEALITPARIHYVGKSVNLYSQGWRYHGSASVILRYLRMGYLWETVRVRGGAYGAFCSLDRVLGTLRCVSYRDPNTVETLEAYDQMAHFLKNFTPDTNQLAQAIVGAVGDLDTYRLPSARGAVALGHTLSKDTEEQRQRMREEMLATSARDFASFADVLALLKEGDSCVLGGKDLEKTALERGWACTKIL